MILIKTSFIEKILRGSAKVIAVYPFVIMPKGFEIDDRLLNHERIHLRQQLELLILPFYILYLGEYLIRRVQFASHHEAYRNISFEREAYQMQDDKNYLRGRRLWSYTKFYRRKKESS